MPPTHWLPGCMDPSHACGANLFPTCTSSCFHCLSFCFHFVVLSLHCLSLCFLCLSLRFHCLSLCFHCLNCNCLVGSWFTGRTRHSTKHSRVPRSKFVNSPPTAHKHPPTFKWTPCTAPQALANARLLAHHAGIRPQSADGLPIVGWCRRAVGQTVILLASPLHPC